jgi:phosphoribosylformylglycinamidine synthase PurS subunit
VIELEIPGSDVATVEATAAEMCDRLLANPVLEDYRIAVTL